MDQTQNKKTKTKQVGAAKLTIDILRNISNRRGGIGVTPLATQLNRYPGTVYAVLKTLQEEGMVEFNSETKTYSLCLGGILELTGKMREENLAKRIEADMQEAADTYGVCLYLSQHVRRDYMVIVACAAPDKPLGIYAKVGTRFPAYFGGSGRILSSRKGLDKDHLKSAYDKTKWAADKPLFEDWADQVRKDYLAGYAYEEDTLPEGLASIAVPVTNGSASIKYTINAIAPRGDLAGEKLQEVILIVKNLAGIASTKV